MRKRLDIVSLGPGKIDQLTIEARDVLLKSKKIYCRFMTPLLNYLVQKYKKPVISFENFYINPDLNKEINRSGLYMKIAELVIDEALLNEGVVYALPGSAFMGEDTTYLIYDIAKTKGLVVNTILGISFVDVLLCSLPTKYKKYISPDYLTICEPLLDNISFNKCYSYIIIQTSDMIRLYKPQRIKKILSRYYPQNFKFLYIFYKNDKKNFSYDMKIIEFQIKDINRFINAFKKYNGSIFVPSWQIDNEVKYKMLYDITLRHRNVNRSLKADLKFEESLALFKLKRYSEALKIAQNARPHAKKKGIDLIIGTCLVKCGRFHEAISELKKAEKENPNLAEINHLLGVCYKNLGQTDKFWIEIGKILKKKKNITSKNATRL